MTLIESIVSRWTKQHPPGPELLQAYQATFGSLQGQQVLQHLISSVYVPVTYSKDPLELAAHNARRTVVQEILDNVYATDAQPKE